MSAILTAIALGASVIAIIVSLILESIIGKKPAGSKKMSDIALEISKLIKQCNSKFYSTLGIIAAIIFVILLYIVGWKIALGYLAGVIVSGVISFVESDLFLKSGVRAAEAARKENSQALGISFKSGTALSMFGLGLALVSVAGLYTIFKDVSVLFGLVFGSAIIPFARRIARVKDRSENSEINANVTEHQTGNTFISDFFLISAAIITVAIALGITAYPAFTNAVYFPLVLSGAMIISAIIGSFFLRSKGNFKVIRGAVFPALIASTVIFAAGSYFLTNWLMKGNGTSNVLYIYFALLIGIIAPLLLLLFEYLIGRSKLEGENAKLILIILLILIIAAAILSANRFAGLYGIALAALGLITYGAIVISGGVATSTMRSAEMIGQASGLSEESRVQSASIKSLEEAKKMVSGYPVMVVSVSMILLFHIFIQRITDRISASTFNVNDPYIIAGLLVGALCAYYFGKISDKSVSHGTLVPVAIAIASLAILGIFLGAPIVVGLLVGLLIASIILALKEKDISSSISTLFASSIMILFIPLITIAYSQKAKLIVGIALIVIILAYILAARSLKKEAK